MDLFSILSCKSECANMVFNCESVMMVVALYIRMYVYMLIECLST